MPIANPERLKYPMQRLSDWALNLFPLTAVSTATVSGTPLVTAYPLARVTITGATNWSSVYPNMLVRITRSGTLVYSGAVRKVDYSAPDALYLGALMFGDTGYNTGGNLTIASGDTVTIYSVRVPWGFWSRIDLDTEEIYKKWDEEVLYDGTTISKTEFPQPVANLGAWQRGVVDPISGVATLTHSAATSTVWRGSSFTVQWALPSGAALVSGYSLTDPTIEVEYDAGTYLIGCTITEVGGSTPARTRTAWRYVWAVDGSTVLDTSDTVACEVISDTSTYDEGRTLTVRLTGTGTQLSDALYAGAPVLMTYTTQYSNDAGESWVGVPEQVGVFAGYLTNWTAVQSDGQVLTVDAVVENALSTCKRVGVHKQLLRVRSVGNEWVNTVAANGTVAYFAYYLLAHHVPWVMDMHDFDASAMSAFRLRAFRSDATDIATALQRAAAYCLNGTAGCTSDGKIVLKRDPRIESNTYNSGLDERWTIDADHIAESFSYALAPIGTVYDVRGDFWVSTNTRPIDAYIARTNSQAPSQGTRMETTNSFIATSLTDGLQRVGHYKAAANSPIERLEIPLAALQDVIDPAAQALYRLDLASVDALNTGLLDDVLAVARTVNRQWQTEPNGETSLSLSASFVPLTRGQAGVVEMQPGIGLNRGGLTYSVELLDNSPSSGWAVFVAGAGTYDGGANAWLSGSITRPNGRKLRQIDVQADFPSPFQATAQISISFDLTLGTVVNPEAACIQLLHTRSNGTTAPLATVTFAQAAGVYEGTNVTFNWTGRIVLKGLRIRLASCIVNPSDPLDGTVRLLDSYSRVLVTS
jgi:hypothetical protein